MTEKGSRFDKVTICGGHVINAPDRKTPRFPQSKAEAVLAMEAAIADLLRGAGQDILELDTILADLAERDRELHGERGP